MDWFSRHRRLVSGLTHEAVSRAIEMWCLHCSPCIFARPRGSAYKRLCPSVCPRFPSQQFRLQPAVVGEDWRGGLGDGGVLHAFFSQLFSHGSEWGDRTFVQPILGGVEFGCGNMSDLGGFLQFFVLVQCTQHKGICEYQKICNCNNFLGEMVHYLTEVQRRQEATRLLTMAVETPTTTLIMNQY